MYRRVRGLEVRHPHPEETYRRLCDLLDGDVRIRVDEFGGVFELDPRSHLFKRVFLNGTYEPHLARIARAFGDLGGDFLDLGANVGFYSVMMAQHPRIRNVLSVEPVQATIRRLQRNLTLNGLNERVIVFCGALLDSPGEITIRFPIGNEEFASSGKMTHGSLMAMPELEFASEIVNATTLDMLVKSHQLKPSVIKIDTEGTEHLVLRGGINTIQSHRPFVIAEINDKQLRDNGSSGREILDAILDCGYSSFDADTLEASEVVRDYGNMLFVASSDDRQRRILDSLREPNRRTN